MDTKREQINVTRAAMPDFDNYVEKIRKLWDSHWITNMGTYHKELEEQLKCFLQTPEISLMVNGHMSLELAIQVMDLPEDGEVITTPYTFVSTTHAIVRNHLKPVFCDIKLSDYTIDEEKIESLITDRTVAIVPVHVYGNICNVEKICDIAKRHSLKVVFDAAHSFAETYKGRGIANFGDASVFSFHATKVFNTIEGGAVAFQNHELYDRLYQLKNFGICSQEQIGEVGCNAKMNEFCAAMGLCNLENVKENIGKRKQCVEYYLENLSGIEGLKLPVYKLADIEYNYAYFPVLFQPEILGTDVRNYIYDILKEENIFTRKYFFPLTPQADCYKNQFKTDNLQNAAYVADNILTLPLYPELGVKELDRICGLLKGGIKRYEERD